MEELGLADVIIDARASVLNPILQWLNGTYEEEVSFKYSSPGTFRPFVLETPLLLLLSKS